MKKQFISLHCQLSTLNCSPKQVLLFILVFSVFLFSGCISDDDDDCDRGVSLRFTYLLNSRFTCLFTEQVQEIDLYIYDMQGNLYQNRQVAISSLVENRLHLDLPAGDYKLMVWGNPDSRYYWLESPENYASFRLHTRCNEQGEVPSSLGSLFHGAGELHLKQFGNTEQTIAMIKNTNRIRVLLERHVNAPSSSVFERYKVGVSGSNGSYDATNCNQSPASLQYPAECTVMPQVEAAFTVLRLAQDDDVKLQVSHAITGEVFGEIPVVTELMKHPHIHTNEDLDRYDEYLLRYELNETDELTLIGINDWTVSNVGGGV